MGAMWGNVYGPTKDDTKDYMFEIACARFLKMKMIYMKKIFLPAIVKRLLTYMGCYDEI